MCGNAGCIGKDDAETVNIMLDALPHRGPNDRGIHINRNAVFGHTRLSIVDVAQGHQPKIFESGLKHGFRYPGDHVSRTTLYTFEQTLALTERIKAEKILFIHLEEYWNRSHGDYLAIQKRFGNVQFAYDGMRVSV